MRKGMFILVLAAANAYAQQTATGTLAGIVTDPSGSILAGTKVTAVNANTGFTSEGLTNETGRFSVPYLNPGRYELRVEAPGFRTYIRTGIELRAGESPRIDVALELGAVSESVSVSGAAPLLTTESATSAGSLSNQVFMRIPILQLRTYSVMGYLPGVSTVGGYSFNAVGQRDRSLANTLDGVSAKTPVEGAAAGDYQVLIGPADAMQEVRVLTTGVPAEYGRMGGGMMIAVSKSGTNQFHGEAEDRYTPKLLIHRPYFATAPQPPLNYQDISLTMGGPVVLPKIYNGRNKTFIFGGWQRQDERSSGSSAINVPSAEMQNGDFSFGGLGLPIYDPYSTELVSGAWVRTQFPNNRIPASLFDPVAKNFLAQNPYAKPNQPGFLQAIGPQQNFSGASLTRSYRTRFTWKVDHQISSSHKVYGRLTWNRHRRRVKNPLYGDTAHELLDPSWQFNPIDFYSPVFSDTLTLTPTTINEFRVGFTRFTFKLNPFTYGEGWAQKLGIPNTPPDTFPQFNNMGFAANPGGYSQRVAEELTITESLTKIVGVHTFKVGWESNRSRYNNREEDRPSGIYDFTNATAYPFRPNTGNQFAGFLLGAVQSAQFSQNRATWLPRWWTHAFFFQDDYRPTKNLTLNLGLRWSYESPFGTKYGQQSQFDPNVRDPLTGLPGAITHPKGLLAKRDLNNLQPRFGLAWTFRPKLVFRGSFSVMIPDLQSPSRGIAFEEYVATANIQPPTGDPRLAFRLSQGPPALPYTVNADGTVPFLGTNLSARGATWFDPKMRMPYVMSWSAGVQWQMSGTWLWETIYQGSAGIGLLGAWDINVVPLNVSSDIPTLDRIFAATQNYKPYTQFGTVRHYSNYGHSTYHGLTFRAEKRYSHGMTLNTFYTYSKTLDDSDGDTNAAGITYFNRSLEKAVAGYDLTHRFVSAFTFDLPLGSGRRFMNTRGWRDKIFGNWQLTWSHILNSGQPFTVSAAGSPSRYLPGNLRPNIVMPFDQAKVQDYDIGPHRFPTAAQNPYLQPAAFAYPAPYAAGSLGRNTFRSPWIFWPQASLAKQWVVKENLRFSMRYDVTNPVTWPNFKVPGSAYNTSSLGTFARFTSAGGFNGVGSQLVAAVVGRVEW